MDLKAMPVVCAIFVTAASGSFNRALKAQSTAPTTAPKTAEQQFKNIQVLKGIPAEQLFPTMQFISASLGVECDFCHVQNAFEKDDKKPKQVARKMIEMMYAINKDNFEGHREVTCNSCHRGSAHPVAIPAVMTEEPKAAMGDPHATADHDHDHDMKAEGSPAPDALVENFLKASGGSAAIDKITSRVMKGTIDVGGKALRIDIYAKDPEKRISFTHMTEGDSVTAFNGQEGWLASPGRPLREMHGSDLDSAAIDADLHLATHFKSMFAEMRLRGSEKVGDQDTYVVMGRRDGKPPLVLYFDKSSGLLLRLVRYGDTALGLLPTQIDYSDYRDTDGVKVPYRWSLARPSGRFTIQVAEMKQNVPVDDSKFVKPASPPDAAKPLAR